MIKNVGIWLQSSVLFTQVIIGFNCQVPQAQKRAPGLPPIQQWLEVARCQGAPLSPPNLRRRGWPRALRHHPTDGSACPGVGRRTRHHRRLRGTGWRARQVGAAVSSGTDTRWRERESADRSNGEWSGKEPQLYTRWLGWKGASASDRNESAFGGQVFGFHVLSPTAWLVFHFFR